MSEMEGYLQNKIREQNDKIIGLENEIKTMKITIEYLKKQYEKAEEQMNKAMSLEEFQNTVTGYIKNSLNKNINEILAMISKKNKEQIGVFVKDAMTQIKKRLDVIDEQVNMYTTSLIATLLTKNILTKTDAEKIIDEREELKTIGLTKAEEKQYAQIGQILKKEDRKMRRKAKKLAKKYGRIEEMPDE